MTLHGPTRVDSSRDITLGDVALLCGRAKRGEDYATIVADHYFISLAEAKKLVAQARSKGLLS